MLEYNYYRQHDLVDVISKLGFCFSHSGRQVHSQRCSIQWVSLSKDVTRSVLEYQADNVDHWDKWQYSLLPSSALGRFHDLGWTWTLSSLSQHSDPKPGQSEVRSQQIELFEQNIFTDNLHIMGTVSFHLPHLPPMWSGYLKLLHDSLPHPGISSDILLSMIDLTPSNSTGVQSTLEWIIEHASLYNTTPVITFDQ